MKELLRTNDVVRLSWLQALLANAGIATHVFDVHTSVVEGSIGILPRRANPVQKTACSWHAAAVRGGFLWHGRSSRSRRRHGTRVRRAVEIVSLIEHLRTLPRVTDALRAGVEAG